jgi:glutathione S-transferase
MYQLFYSPGACSMAVHVTLIETGASYKLLKASDNAEALKKSNPGGQVPTLVVDGKPLTEGAAILTYLCENEKSALLPASGWQRAKAMQWLAFANSTMHPRYSACFGAMRVLGAEAQSNPLYGASVEKIQQGWDIIEAELAQHDYIAGSDITVADILLAVIANWTPRVTDKVTFGVKTKAYLKRVTSRPSYQKALAAEQVEYKVAA